MDFDMENGSAVDLSGSERRLGNTISLLIPARNYRIQCAWIQEEPLPAIEEFACRLLLLFERLLPSQLQGFFNLDDKEREVLIDDLTKNRLVTINSDGYIEPADLLQKKFKANPGDTPMLNSFDERSESVIFDLLTLSVMPRKPLSEGIFGLPELPLPEGGATLSTEKVKDAFGSQYRAHLDFMSKRPGQKNKITRLYKINDCMPDKLMQIPVEMTIQIEPSLSNAAPIVYRDVIERIGSTRKRRLSADLEHKITEYLADLDVPTNGISFSQYCNLVDDEVLSEYAHGDSFDFSAWLRARENRKTGYGSPETTAILGPIYLFKNRETIRDMLKKSSAIASIERHRAVWYPSNSPLWGASEQDLFEFNRRICGDLTDKNDFSGVITLVKSGGDNRAKWGWKHSFEKKVSNGIILPKAEPQDRMEIFCIPGVLATVQFHIQPSDNSGVTVPIGYVTVDSDRIKLVEKVLSGRLASLDRELLWGGKEEKPQVDDLLKLSHSYNPEGVYKKSATENNSNREPPPPETPTEPKKKVTIITKRSKLKK